MEEIWKSIPDYPNYEISSLGRVKSLARYVNTASVSLRYIKESFLNPKPNNKGYIMVYLYNDTKPAKRVSIHRLVASLFIGDIHNISVDHINGIKVDNRVINLRLATTQQNAFNRNPKGYWFRKNRNKYQAELRVGETKHILGLYETKEEAREAYIEGCKIYHGEFIDRKVNNI